MKRVLVLFITILIFTTPYIFPCFSRNKTKRSSPISQQRAISETKRSNTISLSFDNNETEIKYTEQELATIEEENKKLLAAAEEGDLEKAIEALNNGALVNTINQEYDTPLCLACFRGFPDIVKLLLEKGADVSHKGYLAQSPLHFAVYAIHGKKYASIVQLLLNFGANPYMQDGHGRTSLAAAVDYQSTEALDTLLSHGIDPNHPDHYARERHAVGTSPLQVSITYRFPHTTPLLLAADADINISANNQKKSRFACYSAPRRTLYDDLSVFEKNICEHVQAIKKRATQEFHSSQYVLHNSLMSGFLPVVIRTLVADYALPYADLPCLENNFHRNTPARRYETVLIKKAITEAKQNIQKQSTRKKNRLFTRH